MRARAALCGLAIAACGRADERAEAARVLRAIDALREATTASADARETLLAALAAERADLPAAKRARDACASAYRPLVEGRRKSESVRAALADAGRGDPRLPTELEQAEALIRASGDAMPACESAIADLRREARN